MWSRAGRRYLSLLEAPPLEETRSYIRHIIAHGHPQRVALAASEVVGLCDVTPNSRPALAHAGALGMGLLQPFRGRGIGTRLLQRTLEASRAFGLTRIELTVRESNASAIALYKKLGFEIEGRQRKAIRIGEAYEDRIAMAVLF